MAKKIRGKSKTRQVSHQAGFHTSAGIVKRVRIIPIRSYQIDSNHGGIKWRSTSLLIRILRISDSIQWSFQMLGLSQIHTIYVSRFATDMRKGIDGLCGSVEEVFHQDPLNGNAYVFFNRRKTMVKLLLWSRDGFCVFMKRLERGSFSLKTLGETGSIELTELLCILDGIDLSGSRRRKRFCLPHK